MNLLRIPTLLAAALVLIAGYTDAADANTVPAASDLQERMLNEQIDVKPNGIGITSPQHESKSGKSKSAKNGSNNVNVIDNFVAFAFGTFGFIGLANNNIINEEKSIDILTRVVRKANDLESTIIGEEGGGGRPRLQESFGINDNLFLAYLQVSALKKKGFDDKAILDQLSLVFTERVVGIIFGILVEPTPQPSEGPSVSSMPSESLSPSLGPSENPSESPTDKCRFTLPNNGTGTAGLAQFCSQDEECFGCK